LRIVLAAITIAFYSEVGVADAYFNAEKSAKLCGICGKLKFRLGLSSDPSNFRIVLAAITIDFYSSFFLEKKGPKFKPALRRMLKHRKNVALHAQFFARWRF
jgi:hypothetical protein